MTGVYDELGRLTSVGFNTDGTGAIEETVSYEYDISGNRTTLILPNTDEINYAYDDTGRLVSMTDWDNQTSTFQYDKLGRHVGTQRSNGFTSKYAYNKAGHLQELRHGEGWNTVKTLQSFVYETDARGNRTQVKEVSLRDTADSSVTMAHDDESIVYSGDWDANGSFHETTETNAKLAVMFFGNTGINLTMGTGDDCGIYDVYINQTLWQSYDGYASSAGEDVIALEVKGDGAHLLEVFQRREKNSASSGYKVRFKQLVALEAYDVGTIDYTYDDLSRLLTANYDGGAVEYTYGYDLAGNLVDNNGVTNTFNDANQLTGDGTDTFDYDDNGNLWKTNSIVSHTWDKANRLLSHGGLDYAYDGLGNRISQDNGTDVTKYLLDIQAGLPRVLSETVGANVTQFVHSPRGLHATQNNSNNWFWGLQDGLGSQRAEVDVNGAVVASQEFTPYGVAQNVTGSFSSPHAFTGEPLDGNGLQYHRARYMNPALGGFLSLDPFEGVQSRPMSLNGYSWVEGNPVMWTDASGLQAGQSNCGAWNGARGLVSNRERDDYLSLFDDSFFHQSYLDVANRRRNELRSIVSSNMSQLQQSVLSGRDCEIENIVSDNSLRNILTGSNLDELFGLTSDEEFAARMAAVPAVANVAGWYGDIFLGASGSAGYWELRYTDREFLELVRGRSFDIDDIMIQSLPITDYMIQIENNPYYFSDVPTEPVSNTRNCSLDPRQCWYDYVYPESHEITIVKNTMLAEIAGANLLRRYLEYLEQWSWNPPLENEKDLVAWRLLSPTAYAVHCTQNGFECKNQGAGVSNNGWGGISDGDARVADYDNLIRHFRYVFDSSGNNTLSRCLIRPSMMDK